MNRRQFLASAAGASVMTTPLFSAPKGAIIELRRYQMRNNSDQMTQRTVDLISKAAIPAAKRAGLGPVGLFSNLIGPQGPHLLLVTSYPSLAAMEEANEKMAADRAFQKELDAYYAKPGLGYVRIESTLLRAIDTMPQIEPTTVEEGKDPHVFELRVYESNNASTLRRKVKMFEDGELAIFRRLKMIPVFFGTAIAGANMPNLTYMLAYDSLAHREQVWKQFSADPEWQKMRVLPGLSDAEVVSNISNAMFRPLPSSQIR